MRCNLCGCTDFIDMNSRKNVRCKICGSLERTRLIWLYIERLGLTSDSRVLHLAPEKGLFKKISEIVKPENYTIADFSPKSYRLERDCIKIDLTSMESWPSNEFDLILHVHVMEHIPCNVAYSVFHLHRMLKQDGTHLCIIPFTSGVYDECFDDIGDSERTRRFGQYDHVRKFGRDGLAMHLGKIVNLPSRFDATEWFSRDLLKQYNIPMAYWTGFHIGTVLSLKKNDYRLSFK